MEPNIQKHGLQQDENNDDSLPSLAGPHPHDIGNSRKEDISAWHALCRQGIGKLTPFHSGP